MIASERAELALYWIIIYPHISHKEQDMSIEGKAKEAAGFVKEELNEHGDSPEAKKKAHEGRDLRNEGRIEDGKAPKTTEPGTGAKQ